MTKTSGNCFYIVNLYFPCHFVKAFGLAVLSNRPSSLVSPLSLRVLLPAVLGVNTQLILCYRFPPDTHYKTPNPQIVVDEGVQCRMSPILSCHIPNLYLSCVTIQTKKGKYTTACHPIFSGVLVSGDEIIIKSCICRIKQSQTILNADDFIGDVKSYRNSTYSI